MELEHRQASSGRDGGGEPTAIREMSWGQGPGRQQRGWSRSQFQAPTSQTRALAIVFLFFIVLLFIYKHRSHDTCSGLNGVSLKFTSIQSPALQSYLKIWSLQTHWVVKVRPWWSRVSLKSSASRPSKKGEDREKSAKTGRVGGCSSKPGRPRLAGTHQKLEYAKGSARELSAEGGPAQTLTADF